MYPRLFHLTPAHRSCEFVCHVATVGARVIFYCLEELAKRNKLYEEAVLSGEISPVYAASIDDSSDALESPKEFEARAEGQPQTERKSFFKRFTKSSSQDEKARFVWRGPMSRRESLFFCAKP